MVLESAGPKESMSVLDLTVCPICQAQSSLARQKIKLEGEPHIAYECLECGSLLLWLDRKSVV